MPPIKIKPAVSQDEFLGVAGAVDNLEDRVMVLEHALASLLRDIYDEHDQTPEPDAPVGVGYPEFFETPNEGMLGVQAQERAEQELDAATEALHDGSETVVGDPDDWAQQEAARLRAEAANEAS